MSGFPATPTRFVAARAYEPSCQVHTEWPLGIVWTWSRATTRLSVPVQSLEAPTMTAVSSRLSTVSGGSSRTTQWRPGGLQ
ncbi:hypothetical protein P3T39_003383 [Kitasatospora sp. GP82]|nr:hypothetical protein [Kitasatospora sp. GP82]